MAYDAESDLHYVTTLHEQELTVARNDCECGQCPRLVCIWVGEAGEERPLAFTRDEDTLLIAKLLIEAVLDPDEDATDNVPF